MVKHSEIFIIFGTIAYPKDNFCFPPCGNTRIEYKNNSGLLKPKTEFRFN